MEFSEAEIDAARRLRSMGLTWEPAPGHYVFDESRVCERGSPFQEGVYFILNYEFFVRMLGGLENFKEKMLWLPTWGDLRLILRNLGIADHAVAEHLTECRAIEKRNERLALYALVESVLAKDVTTEE